MKRTALKNAGNRRLLLHILRKGLGLFIWKTERDWEADWDLSCFRQDVQSDAEMCGNFPGCAGRTEAAALC